MALCFLAVIILSFFTGIAIGYIIFEFYIIKRNGINFNYVEGDEVNNFLEEIRRSKDNGARMLNYRTNTRSSIDTVLTRTETTPQTGHNSRTASLSSRLRKNLNATLEGYEEIIPTETEDTVIPNNEQVEEQQYIDNEIINEETPEMEEMDDGLDSSEEDFVADDEFLKKYYITEDDEKRLSDSTMTDVEEIVVEDTTPSDTIDDIDETSVVKNDNTIEETHNVSNDTHDMETVLNADVVENDDLQNIEETNPDKIVSNTAIELPTSAKQDKIVSNVCIQLGGTTTKENPSSFVAIPLTMTEKPVEPDAPPKRKRGRPRKKK